MEQEPDDLGVTITVVRTGGFAGLRRQWVAVPPAAEAPRWIALIDGCPWDDTGDADAANGGADRFVWLIDARTGGARHEMTLPETRLTGPWRQLVDEVQAFEQERGGRG